jgi:hypothetical protein
MPCSHASVDPAARSLHKDCIRLCVGIEDLIDDLGRVLLEVEASRSLMTIVMCARVSRRRFAKDWTSLWVVKMRVQV